MPLSLDQLRRSRTAVLRNASELLSDALCLQVDNRFARAFALSVLAAEELGKLAMLVRASYALNANETFDWDRLHACGIINRSSNSSY